MDTGERQGREPGAGPLTLPPAPPAPPHRARPALLPPRLHPVALLFCVKLPLKTFVAEPTCQVTQQIRKVCDTQQVPGAPAPRICRPLTPAPRRQMPLGRLVGLPSSRASQHHKGQASMPSPFDCIFGVCFSVLLPGRISQHPPLFY